MAEERTVLEHLLDGRDALQREVSRLTAAIGQLDSVLGRIGTMGTGNGATESVTDVVAVEPEPIASQPVNPPAEVEPAVPAAVPSRARAPRKAPAKKAAPRTRRPQGEAPKSIRVHVLEMLTAENRDFGLAEIIDRIHASGIQAHDDAVRSITIKLMKDGRVERVGRGQYRLARRGAAARAASAATATAARVTEVAPEPAPEPAADPVFEAAPEAAPEPIVDAAAAAAPEPAPAAEVVEPAAAPDEFEAAAAADFSGTETAQRASWPAEDEADGTGAHRFDPPASDADAGESEADSGSDYTPPLNLGQPWS